MSRSLLNSNMADPSCVDTVLEYHNPACFQYCCIGKVRPIEEHLYLANL